jgi:hypothetical protein
LDLKKSAEKNIYTASPRDSEAKADKEINNSYAEERWPEQVG